MHDSGSYDRGVAGVIALVSVALLVALSSANRNATILLGLLFVLVIFHTYFVWRLVVLLEEFLQESINL